MKNQENPLTSRQVLVDHEKALDAILLHIMVSLLHIMASLLCIMVKHIADNAVPCSMSAAIIT